MTTVVGLVAVPRGATVRLGATAPPLVGAP